MSTTTVNFTMKDVNGNIIPFSTFQIESGRANTGYIPDLIPASTTFATDASGQASVDLVVTTAPYYISAINNGTEHMISYKFFVPASQEPINAEILYVDLNSGFPYYNDKHMAALIEAKIAVINARNQVMTGLNGDLPGGGAILNASQINFSPVAGPVNNLFQEITKNNKYMVIAETFGATGNGIDDDTAAIQAAVDYAIANGVTEIAVNGIYRLVSTVTVQGNVTFVGKGYKDTLEPRGITLPSVGSWFIHDPVNATTPAFVFTGRTAKRYGFKNIAFFQTGHPNPGIGWAPAVRDWVIKNFDTQGSMVLERVHFHNVYKGVETLIAVRQQFQDITGQFFFRGFSFDRVYDLGKFDGLHAWTYWSEDASVLQWQQQNNSVTIQLGRVDGMWMDRIFAIAQSVVVWIPNASADVVGATSKVINIGGLYSDFCGRALVIEALNPCHVTVDSLFHLGQLWKSEQVPLPESCAIDILDGSNHKVQVNNVYSVLTGGEAIKVRTPYSATAPLKGFCDLWVGSLIATSYAAAVNSTAAAMAVTATNQIRLGSKPLLLPKPDSLGLASELAPGSDGTVIQPIAEVTKGKVVNRIAAVGADTDGVPYIGSIGETNTSVGLAASGTGTAILGVATNKVGFYGSPGAVKPTGVAVTAQAIHTALVSLGLISA